jgi:hypothetical protein
MRKLIWLINNFFKFRKGDLVLFNFYDTSVLGNWQTEKGYVVGKRYSSIPDTLCLNDDIKIIEYGILSIEEYKNYLKNIKQGEYNNSWHISWIEKERILKVFKKK